ncbi:hypothetical protein ABZ917_48175 [Nonomuraea wenchangensis]
MKGSAVMTPGSAASRWLQGPDMPDPTQVHLHRCGPHDSLPTAAVVNLLPGLPYWDRSRKAARSQQRLGIQALLAWLAWLASFPGVGWQDRWSPPAPMRCPGLTPVAGSRSRAGALMWWRRCARYCCCG